VPETAIQTSKDFASPIVDERDPHKFNDAITQLNEDLADNGPEAAAIAINCSES
jgi:hypothetical protein